MYPLLFKKRLLRTGFRWCVTFGCKPEDLGAQFKVDLTGKIKSVTLVTNEPAVNSLRYVFTYDGEGNQTGYELTDSAKATTTTALYSRDSTGRYSSQTASGFIMKSGCTASAPRNILR
jgi:hypothetical protein